MRESPSGSALAAWPGVAFWPIGRPDEACSACACAQPCSHTSESCHVRGGLLTPRIPVAVHFVSEADKHRRAKLHATLSGHTRPPYIDAQYTLVVLQRKSGPLRRCAALLGLQIWRRSLLNKSTRGPGMVMRAPSTLWDIIRYGVFSLVLEVSPFPIGILWSPAAQWMHHLRCPSQALAQL